MEKRKRACFLFEFNFLKKEQFHDHCLRAQIAHAQSKNKIH